MDALVSFGPFGGIEGRIISDVEYERDTFKIRLIVKESEYEGKLVMIKDYWINKGTIAEVLSQEISLYNYFKGLECKALPKGIYISTPTEQSLKLVYEYSKDSLHSYFQPLQQQRESLFKEKNQQFFLNLRNLIEALIQIHKFHGHGGICPSQILISKNKLMFAPFVPKQIESSFLNHFGKDTVIPSLYKAPEFNKIMLGDFEAVKKADVYSLGLCIFLILCPEFSIFDINSLIDSNTPEVFTKHIKIKNLAEMLYFMLLKSPDQRISLEMCLQFLDQFKLEIFPYEYAFGNPFEAIEKVGTRKRNWLNIWRVRVTGQEYLLYVWKFVNPRIFEREKKRSDDFKNLNETNPWYFAEVKFNSMFGSDFVVMITILGSKLRDVLEQSYTIERAYILCFAVLDYVYTLRRSEYIQTDLTLDSVFCIEDRVLTYNFEKIKKVDTISLKKASKNESLRSYPYPELLNMKMKNSEELSAINIDKVFAYSLGILILKIIYFNDYSISSNYELDINALINYTKSIQGNLGNFAYHLLFSNEYTLLQFTNTYNFPGIQYTLYNINPNNS